MLKLWVSLRAETFAVKPAFQAVEIVSGRSALTKSEHVGCAENQRNSGHHHGSHERDFVHAEQNQHENDRDKCTARQIPEKVSIQSPRPALRIVGTVRFRESEVVGVH